MVLGVWKLGKIVNSSSISPKLCLLGQKETDMGVNTIYQHQIYIEKNVLLCYLEEDNLVIYP